MFNKILNLPSILIKEHYQLDSHTYVFVVESSQKKAVCTRCGMMSKKLHQNHYYLVKDLPVSNYDTYLKINRRQWKCEQCNRPFSEELEWLKKRRRYTSRFANYILKQLVNSNIKAVSEINNVTEAEIERMLKDIEKQVKNKEIKTIKKLGIDEISLKKGKHNYCAVLVDIEKGELLRILEGRTKDILRSEFNKWREEVLNNIEEVSIDLWRGYQTIVEELMPKAEIVADRFHVMKQINEELDNQRKKERRKIKTIKNKQEKEKKLKGIIGSKYILLKKEEKLTEEEKEKLKIIKKIFPKLKKMYEKKEEIREIYESGKNWEEGLEKIGKWLEEVKNIYPESRKTIRNWLGEIVSYFDNRTTQGKVEGINNKIKLIKRLGYGFKNFNNFCTRVLLSWHLKNDLAY